MGVTQNEVSAQALQRAVDQRHIEPHFQPIVSLSDRRVLGFEVLARWRHPDRGLVPPAEFIPLADRLGLLDAILEQLMRTAFAAAASWPHHLFLGFNVSPTQLHDTGLVSRVRRAAHDSDFPTARVHIEVTESAFIDDIASSKATLDLLIGLGCVVAMDDFGTGYSSLTWLSTLPFSKIKIDAQFVSAMIEHRQSRKIVSAVISLGHSLGLAVVAEGVEHVAEAEMLRDMGCQLAQGFLFGRPVPASDIPALLNDIAEYAVNPSTPLPLSAEFQAFQLSDLYKSDQTAIAFSDPSGTVIASSAAFNSMMDIEGGDVTGRHIGELIAVTSETLAQLRATDLLGHTFPAFEEVTAGGALAWIMVRPIKDESGELIGFSIVCADVSHRQPTHPVASDVSPAVDPDATPNSGWSWHLDKGGLVVDVDDSHEEQGGEPKPALGLGWMDFVHPDDIEAALGAWADAVPTGGSYEVQLRLHDGGGRYQWHRLETSPVFDANGGVVSWRGRCEPLLLDAPHGEPRDDEVVELAYSFDVAPYLQWIARPDGMLRRVSSGPAAPHSRNDDMLSVRFYEYWPAADELSLKRRCEQLLSQEQPFDFTYAVHDSSGELVWVHCYATPRRGQDGSVTAWHGAFVL
jgi:EAL domain-containing protein (putative c-di-GMP-specific phosphodiesterase class I)/PAS domain-containing protein